MTMLLRVGAFLAGLFGVLSILSGIGWLGTDGGWRGALFLGAGTYSLIIASSLRERMHQRLMRVAETASVSPTDTQLQRNTVPWLRRGVTFVVAVMFVLAVIGIFLPDETETLSASARVSFASYALAELGTSTGRCDDAAERATRITWICGDYTRGYSAFIANWERLTASRSFREQYTLTPESDWLYYEHDDGRPDFYGRFFRLNGEMFLASYNVEDNPGEGDRIFLGFGEPLARMPALATRAVSRE